jgi:hypothetical protein
LVGDFADALRPPSDTQAPVSCRRVRWRAVLEIGPTVQIPAYVIHVDGSVLQMECDVPFATGSKLQVAVHLPPVNGRDRAVTVPVQAGVLYHVLGRVGVTLVCRVVSAPPEWAQAAAKRTPA